MKNERARMILGVLTVLLLLIGSDDAFAQLDPGVRGGPAGAGRPIAIPTCLNCINHI